MFKKLINKDIQDSNKLLLKRALRPLMGRERLLLGSPGKESPFGFHTEAEFRFVPDEQRK